MLILHLGISTERAAQCGFDTSAVKKFANVGSFLAVPALIFASTCVFCSFLDLVHNHEAEFSECATSTVGFFLQ